MKAFMKDELRNWKLLEVLWLAFATAVITGISLYFRENWIQLWAAITGIWCVVLTGKGKRSSFIFGTINVFLYAVVAYEAKYYGEVMLNLLYYFPMGFVGWFMWKKHMDSETSEVKKVHLSKKAWLLYPATGVAIFSYGYLLKVMGGKLPYVDSMSTVVSVVAQILSVFRLTEQWILWIAVDAVTIVLWAVNFAQGGENIATLAMWSVYLFNAIIMYIKWHKESHTV